MLGLRDRWKREAVESEGIVRFSGGGTKGMKSQNPREERFKKDEIRQ